MCFVEGTLIETGSGPVAVEKLTVGDMVLTRDRGCQPIHWIDATHKTEAELTEYPNLRPIRICRAALGANIPSADLVVSPQHRILMRSKIAQ